jgi:hypothetical protein
MVIDSFDNFIETRKFLKTKDRISIIKFSTQANAIYLYSEISNKFDLSLAPQKKGTNFDVAFAKCKEIVQGRPKGLSQVIIFMTDG